MDFKMNRIVIPAKVVDHLSRQNTLKNEWFYQNNNIEPLKRHDNLYGPYC